MIRSYVSVSFGSDKSILVALWLWTGTLYQNLELHGKVTWSPNNLVPIWSRLGWVPGFPIRDCARGCTHRGQSRSMMSAIDVTPKTLFERLYLVLGMGTFGSWVNCNYAPTTPTVHSTTISRFSYNFFPRMVSHFLGHHDSPSNLVESRNPHSGDTRNPATPGSLI